MRRLTLRQRLLLVVGVAVTAALLGLVTAFNLILDNVLERDAGNLARARAAAQIDSLRIDHGRLQVLETPDDGSPDADVWIFAGTKPIEQPRAAAPAVQQAAQELIAHPASKRTVDLAGSDTLLYAAPIVRGGARHGTVVAGVSLAPYEETRKVALLSSAVLGAVVLVLVMLAARWLLAASLRPVTRMTRQAAAWGEHDLERRFALGAPYDELTELAHTLDGLLDRLAASLRRERRFSAEVSHELRTPLARVLAESELALRREREPAAYRHVLELIRRNADQLARTIDALVAAARYEAGGEHGTADAREIAEEAIRACSSLSIERQLDVRISEAPGRLRVGIGADLAERILQPILENACLYGATSVTVALARENGTITYAVEDDGPGVSTEEHEHIFEPGVRGTAPRTAGTPGAGLGLALARRLARTINGDVIADPAAPGGRFLVRLPSG
jgi:signal transduction histidine kinase